MAYDDLNLGRFVGDRAADGARTGGLRIKLMLQELYAKVAALSGINLQTGTITKLPPGSNPTITITGTPPNLFLNLGIVDGDAGAGAPNSADILALAERGDLIAQVANAGVPDSPRAVIDFIRGVQAAKGSYVGASLTAMMTALAGSTSYGRPSTGTFWDIDGLLKTAANNVPRFEYDPLTRLPRGLLIENQARTNSIINNVRLSSATAFNATRTADVSASPDGTVTMSRLTSTVNGGVNTCLMDMLATVPSDSLARTFSVFVRQGNTPTSTINLYYTGGTFVQVIATINWSTKTISGSGNPVLIDCGGGLYRASVTLANNASGNTQAVCRIYVRDQGTSNVIGDYVDTGTWQLEVGDGMSSPIITGASAVTRAADSGFLLDGAKWLPASGGLSACVEFSLNERRASSGSEVVMFSNTGQTSTVRLFEGVGYSNGCIFYVNMGGVTQYQSGSYASALGSAMRFAFAYNDQGYAFAKDNVLSQQIAAAGSPPIDLTRLFLGIDGFMGHIRRVLVYPGRLANAKVQALSNQAAWS